MPVGEHGRELRIFDALPDEERPASRHAVRIHLALEVQPVERGAHLFLEILPQALLTLGILALGRNRDAPAEVLEESAVVEILLDGLDCGFAGAHGPDISPRGSDSP